MENQDNQTPGHIEDIDAALVHWDPLREFAHVIAGTPLEQPLDIPRLLAESENYDPVAAQRTIDAAVEAIRNNLGAILNGEVGSEIFGNDDQFAGLDLSPTAAEALLENLRQIRNAEEAAQAEVEGMEGQEDSSTIAASEGESGNNPGDEGTRSSSGSNSQAIADDDQTIADDDQTMADDISVASSGAPRTGRLHKYITEIGSYQPEDKSRTQVIMHFRAPSDQDIIVFNIDRYDCDALNVDVYRYDGALVRYSQDVGTESYSVDIDACDFGNVDDIKSLGVYLSKEGDVAALILSYTFNDDEDRAMSSPVLTAYF